MLIFTNSFTDVTSKQFLSSFMLSNAVVAIICISSMTFMTRKHRFGRFITNFFNSSVHPLSRLSLHSGTLNVSQWSRSALWIWFLISAIKWTNITHVYAQHPEVPVVESQIFEVWFMISTISWPIYSPHTPH